MGWDSKSPQCQIHSTWLILAEDIMGQEKTFLLPALTR